ncbi:MAG: hypothetical protein A3E25_16635 [Burkholderiales bacterium RIFCSPHIGHO2_12_FULL_69_20]|nr:MAG: hypothetical protein A3E25_16635 [Burkholderiales bacterium RIFCSPHIGHO2_12_FULL_69_20]
MTVYAFRVFDLNACEMVPGNFKATREAIAAMFKAERLDATAEDVPHALIDAQGRFRRLATGWGELS